MGQELLGLPRLQRPQLGPSTKIDREHPPTVSPGLKPPIRGAGGRDRPPARTGRPAGTRTRVPGRAAAAPDGPVAYEVGLKITRR
ncbi:hypothetical protein Sru01_12640 [Sphaerisporangium rufum]|uniref:Uncharacterized protein n=1 Tax=Sphaerisporangium rufum TaxID=1381558 RepID=A0A919R3C8_9ACTN|nr:hypothetical protein Sru01_12640 [Sphaerisporangium rufum]